MTTQGTETRSAETTGSARKGDGPSPAGGAPDHPTATDWQNRAYRAEAECKELRERLGKPVQHIDAAKLHDTLKLFETRAKSQGENLVAPVMAGVLKIIAEAVKQSTTNGR